MWRNLNVPFDKVLCMSQNAVQKGVPEQKLQTEGLFNIQGKVRNI